MTHIKPTKDDAINNNMLLIRKIANKVAKTTAFGLDEEDIYSMALEGALILWRRYDASKGASFTTLLNGCLAREIKKMVSKERYDVHYSAGVKETAARVTGVEDYEDLPVDRLAQLVKASHDMTKNALEYLSMTRHDEYFDDIEYDRLLNGANKSLGDQSVVYVNDFLTRLSPREQKLVRMKVADMSRVEIARSIGCHANVVNQIMRERIRPKLRAYLEKAEG